jgi:hypothetical protein
MGIHDRDWYREILRKRQGLPPERSGSDQPFPPAKPHRPSGRAWWNELWVGRDGVAKPGLPPLAPRRPLVRPNEPWHPLLTTLATVVVCGLIYIIVKVVMHWIGHHA